MWREGKLHGSGMVIRLACIGRKCRQVEGRSRISTLEPRCPGGSGGVRAFLGGLGFECDLDRNYVNWILGGHPKAASCGHLKSGQ